MAGAVPQQLPACSLHGAFAAGSRHPHNIRAGKNLTTAEDVEGVCTEALGLQLIDWRLVKWMDCSVGSRGRDLEKREVAGEGSCPRRFLFRDSQADLSKASMDYREKLMLYAHVPNSSIHIQMTRCGDVNVSLPLILLMIEHVRISIVLTHRTIHFLAAASGLFALLKLLSQYDSIWTLQHLQRFLIR